MDLVLAIRAVALDVPERSSSWTVVGQDGLPIWDAEVFLNYLRTVRASPNTVRTYARHLALLFRWLHLRGARWEALDFETLCLFVQDLSDGTVPVRRAGAVKALEQAKADGRQRAVDANQRTIQQLDTIIVSLQQEKARMARTAEDHEAQP